MMVSADSLEGAQAGSASAVLSADRFRVGHATSQARMSLNVSTGLPDTGAGKTNPERVSPGS